MIQIIDTLEIAYKAVNLKLLSISSNPISKIYPDFISVFRDEDNPNAVSKSLIKYPSKDLRSECIGKAKLGKVKRFFRQTKRKQRSPMHNKSLGVLENTYSFIMILPLQMTFG